MEKRQANEFEAFIDAEGKIAVPEELAHRFSGRRLNVRLHHEEVSTELRARNVTDSEIQRIAELQLETREQVVQFLLTEGALRKSRRFRTAHKGSGR